MDNFINNLGTNVKAVHAGPIIRREEIYKNIEIDIRRKIFNTFFYFTKKVGVLIMYVVIFILIIIFILLLAMRFYYEGKFLSVIDNQDELYDSFENNQNSTFETNLQLVYINWMPLKYGGRSTSQTFKGNFECRINDNNIIISTSDIFGFRKHIYLDKKNINLKKDIFIGYYIKFKIDDINVTMKLLNQKDYIYFTNKQV